MKILSNLGGIKVGPSVPVRIMGVINVSPESFYKDSVSTREKSIGRQAESMEKEGADFIDVGAMSSAPYLQTQITETEEARRLQLAVRTIKKYTSLPISIDAYRSHPAEVGLNNGATILNDITGLFYDPKMGILARQAKGLILMAHPWSVPGKILARPIPTTTKILKQALRRAERHGISFQRIVADPGIGFFRKTKTIWWRWDLQVLHDIRKFECLRVPLAIGVSRKSFIGHILGGLPPSERLHGSLAATALAVWQGASLIRTHDVRATKEVANTAKSLRDL